MFGQGLRHAAFVGDSRELNHWMLKRLIKRAAGLQEEHFHFIDHRDPDLNLHIQKHSIKALIPLGEAPLRQLVGETDVMRWRGRVVPHQMGIWTIPTFQPSRLMHNRSNSVVFDDDEDGPMRNPPRFQGVWMRDVNRAIQVAQHGFTRKKRNYLLDPTPEEFAKWAEGFFTAWLANPERVWLSLDIETPYKAKKDDESEQELEEFDANKQILRISYSYQPGTGVSIPWHGGYFDTIRKLNASLGVKVVWNGVSFDCPLLAENDTPVCGEVWDGMDAYHLYEPDLPKGLEWATAECTDLLPWKHLNIAEPALYSAIDPDAALECMVELHGTLTRRNQWQAFKDYSVRLMPVLAKAAKKGNRIDLEEQAIIRGEATVERDKLLKEIQLLVPRQLKPRTEYKRMPDVLDGAFGCPWTPSFTAVAPSVTGGMDGSDWDILYEPEKQKVCTICKAFASNKSEHFKGSEGPPNPKTGKPTRLKNPCKEAKGEIVLVDAFVPRFLKVEDFNPNSGPQLKAYINHWGHPMGKDKDDSSKETADAKHIESLIKKYGDKHPVYEKVLEVHKLSKTLGTYLPEPDANGYIHTEYVNSPSTWRLGSRKVKHGTQMQNWGKRESNKWAKRCRRTIVASPGCKIVQIDSSSVEAVMLGWFMRDANYIKLASSGVHDWLVCQKLGWEFGPGIADKVKKEAGELREQMKIGNHMTNYGGTAYVLWQTFPKLFKDKAAAEAVQAFIYKAIPKLKDYHHNVRYRAQKEGYLMTPFGIRHPFYDVFTTDEHGKVRDGKDAKRVVAFEPQSSNGTFQRDNLLMVAESKFGQYLCAIANVHDSLGLDCPDELVEEAVEFLLSVFTRPIPQMNGLRVGAEVEVGDNWASFDEQKNPKGMKSVKKVSVYEPGLELARAA